MEKRFKADARNIGEQRQYALRLIITGNVKAGKRNREIADTSGVSAAYVTEVRKLCAEKGVEGSGIGHGGRRQGQKRVLSQGQEQEIRRVILEQTPEEYGFREALWTRSNIRRLIPEKYDIEMKLTTLRDCPNRRGLSARRPVKRERKPDEGKTEQRPDYDYQELHERAGDEGAEIFL